MEFVGNEDDRAALRAEAAEDGEEAVFFGGREDGGGLVEDEDAGVAVEELEDFDALLDADGEGAGEGVGVDGKVVLGAEGADAGGGGFEVEQRGGCAENGVFGDGEGWDEHEVLVDHADAEGDGVGGGCDADGRVVEEDLAGVHLVEAVEDLHEGGLAGAVFAEEGVDFAGGDGEGDGVVG